VKTLKRHTRGTFFISKDEARLFNWPTVAFESRRFTVNVIGNREAFFLSRLKRRRVATVFEENGGPGR